MDYTKREYAHNNSSQPFVIKSKFKTVTITNDTYDALEKMGVEMIDGNTVYKVDWNDFRPYLIGFVLGMVVMGLTVL